MEEELPILWLHSEHSTGQWECFLGLIDHIGDASEGLLAESELPFDLLVYIILSSTQIYGVSFPCLS